MATTIPTPNGAPTMPDNDGVPGEPVPERSPEPAPPGSNDGLPELPDPTDVGEDG
ncbi:MAG: hypothetical protein ACRYG5_07715 [Janthinobacterium lividum]